MPLPAWTNFGALHWGEMGTFPSFCAVLPWSRVLSVFLGKIDIVKLETADLKSLGWNVDKTDGRGVPATTRWLGDGASPFLLPMSLSYSPSSK